MNDSAQIRFDEIIAKDKNALSAEDVAFLRARRSYLNGSQQKEYAKFLKEETPAQAKKKAAAAKKADKAADKATKERYAALQMRAAELGLEDVDVSEEDLVSFIDTTEGPKDAE